MDVRDMQFVDGEFDVILDKSIVDTLCCSTGSIENVDAMLHECWRVLKPDGIYVAICYGEPETRLHYFEGRAEEGLDWLVEHAEFPQDPIHLEMLQMSVEDSDGPTSNFVYMMQKMPPGLSDEGEHRVATLFQERMVETLKVSRGVVWHLIQLGLGFEVQSDLCVVYSLRPQ